MLDKLIDLIIQFIQLFQIYTFVDQYERGVVLRCGKYHRTLEPGIRWMLPFEFERVITTNVKPEPCGFGIQSLHTSDGYAVNIQMGVIFNVEDVKQYLLEIEKPDTVIAVACSGLVADRIQGSSWDDIASPAFVKSLKPGMNRIAKRCGCRITDVYIQDCSSGEAMKYWHEGINVSLG